MAERKILWTATDPHGITISLAEGVWFEHTSYHPEIANYLEAVRATVEDPDTIYYVSVVVKVVLESDNVQRGYVESAILPGRVMKRAILEWKK